MRRVGVVLFLAAVVLSACSTSGNGSSTATTLAGSVNVTPCNYAQAWHDNPTQFSEFATLAMFARKATNSGLRNEGQQLASAVAAHNTGVVDQVMGNVFATCHQLGLVTTTSSTRPTTG
jgi:hypothetical protein